VIKRTLRARMNFQSKKVREIVSKPVISVQTPTPLKVCIEIMKEKSMSQLPVFSGESAVGSINEAHLLFLVGSSSDTRALLEKPVSQFMQETFPQVGPDTPLEAVVLLLSFFSVVLVVSEKKVRG
jgi:predicted transcriptional regulator